jgi:hypothetical protein
MKGDSELAGPAAESLHCVPAELTCRLDWAARLGAPRSRFCKLGRFRATHANLLT